MVYKDFFEDYTNRFLSFFVFKIERNCTVYLFLFSLIYFSGQSQIYQRENKSIYIKKGITFTSKINIADSSASVNIYSADGTTIIRLQENTKSKILLTNNFLRAVSRSNSNYNKLLSVLQTYTVQFVIDFGRKP